MDVYAVEIITTFNRGSRDEREIATGQYQYYADRAEAQRQAEARGVEVVILASGEQLAGGGATTAADRLAVAHANLNDAHAAYHDAQAAYHAAYDPSTLDWPSSFPARYLNAALDAADAALDAAEAASLKGGRS